MVGPDKGLHFVVSFSLGASGHQMSARLLPEADPNLIGGLVALIPGFAKELADALGAGDPSLYDIAWNFLGTVGGLAFSSLIVAILGG